MVANDELLEFAQVFDNHYGTPRAPVEQALAAGRDVLFDIDWQGTQQLARKGPQRHGEHLRAAAVDRRTGAPPAHARARRRAGDQEPHGEGRNRAEPLGGVRLRHRQRRSRPRRFAEVRAILSAERFKRERQTGLSQFVRDLQTEL